jgi:ATP-dependent Clp protease protease subunit
MPRPALLLAAGSALLGGLLVATLQGPPSSLPAARAQDVPPKAPPGGTPAVESPSAQDLVGQAGDIAEEIIDKVIEQGIVRHPVDYQDPVVQTRTILVNGEINPFSVQDVVSKILYLGNKGAAPIDLLIRTNGGWPDDAFAILDAMRLVRAPVNTYAIGSCDSSGAILLAGATGKRWILPHALVSLHFNQDEGDGKYSEERTERERAEAFWKRVAKLPPEFFPLTGDHLHRLSPEDAVKFGVVDAIWTPPWQPPLEKEKK